jgi:hypothetical protein
MKVLVACEESQAVCKAFRERGHQAYSCDIVECSGGHPEWHIKDDVLNVINPKNWLNRYGIIFNTSDGQPHFIEGKWDLIIAHPPCTYLTNGGAVRMFRKEIREYKPYGTFQMVNVDRLKSGIQARDFFMAFYNADCEKIVIENPIPMSVYMLPKPTQVVQPFMFGEPYSKKTCLWLKGVQPLCPTHVLQEYQPFINGGGGRMQRPNYKNKKFAVGSCKRSKTFLGIADAMAKQWG